MLDVFTVLVVLASIGGAMSMAFLVLWLFRREPRAFLWWCIGCGLSTIGIILLALRGSVADLLSIEVANTLVLLGTGFWWAGIRSIDDKPVRAGILVPASIWLAGVFWPVINDDTSLRVVLNSTAMATAFLMIGWQLEYGKPGRHTLRRVLAVLCGVQALLSLIRAAFALSLGVPQNILQGGSWFPWSLFQPILSVFVLAMLAVVVVMQQSEEKLRTAAETDTLTRILNRGGFLARCARVLERAARDGGSVGFILFDLDHFKKINDRHGHIAGDDILVFFANMAAEMVRPTDLVGRLGGEEFAVLLPGVDEAAAHRIAERIRTTFNQQSFPYGDRSIRASVSAGIAVQSGGEADIRRLMAQADEALYIAKADGRNRVNLARKRVA